MANGSVNIALDQGSETIQAKRPIWSSLVQQEPKSPTLLFRKIQFINVLVVIRSFIDKM